MADSFQLPFGSHEERVGYNEAWARDLNKRKAEWERGQLVSGFRCECWQAECATRIRLSPKEWQEVRSQPDHFAVAPGHVAPDIESVVEKYSDFWLVKKQGKAGEVAARLA